MIAPLHSESLANGALRVPIPRNPTAFNSIVNEGAKIAALLDPLADARPVFEPILGSSRASLAVPKSFDGQPLRDSYFAVTIYRFGGAKGGWRATDDGTGDLYINPNVYFANVPEAVWHYELGGYPVVKKWLGYRDTKRREGKPLSRQERDWLREIVWRLTALLALQETLNEPYALACADVLPIQIS